ncbi:DUF805 domain-containing protein [Staphylococcus chromogenes]|uniref:DUF805 domain-containing protein n=1 Tax=Staphylococcus chromogenes TaxID=46126 RepID=UPI000D02A4FD|nr:DUF805 domain-containing protein [Staphylococcus chromogenes]
MNSSQSILSCYKLYWTRAFDVKGRSTRKEFWHPFWINIILYAIVTLLTTEVGGDILSLILVIPTFSVMARRLHDINHSMYLSIVLNGASVLYLIGTYALRPFNELDNPESTFLMTLFIIFFIVTFILLIMGVYSLVLMCIKGDLKPNRYGAGGTNDLHESVSIPE